MASGWTADAVLLAAAGRDVLARAAAEAERLGKDGLRGVARVDGDAWRIGYDRRDGGRHLLTSGIELAPGVRYRSAYDQSYATGGFGREPIASQVVHFEAVVTVTGLVLPMTVLTALGGRHVSALVDLPTLRHPGLVIASAHQDTRDQRPTDVSVLLPTIKVAIGAKGDRP